MNETRVTIVGGGVYGAALAFELCQRGIGVQLFEANEIAGGASGGPGMRGVRANGRDFRELALMAEAYELWPTLRDRLDGPTGYARVGHLNLIERERDLAEAHARAQLQSAWGIETQVLDQAAVREAEPNVSAEVVAALFCPHDGVADHTATTRSFADAARSLGAGIHTELPVVDFNTRPNGVDSIVLSDASEHPVGDCLVLLANANVQALVDRIEPSERERIELPVWSVFPQVILSEPTNHQPVHHLIGHASRVVAIKMLPDARVMVSGGWRGRFNNETAASETVAGQVLGNWREATATFPILGRLEPAYPDVSRRETMTIDGIPIIDALPGFDNVLIGTGWCGHGWAIAPALARRLADWVDSASSSALHGAKPADLSAFSLQRFNPSP